MAHNNPNRARHHEWYAPDGKTYELVDLPHKASFIKMPVEDDKADAVPGDPTNCLLSRCCTREAGGLPAMIGVDKAYIPMLVNGKWIMYRCKVPRKTRAALDAADGTHTHPEGGYVFEGISPSEAIDSQRARKKRSRDRWKNKTREPGKPRKKPLRNAARRAQVFVREENGANGETPPKET